MLDTTVPGPEYRQPDTDQLFTALRDLGLDLPQSEALDFARLHDYLREIDHPLAGLGEQSLAALSEIHGRQTTMPRNPFSSAVDTDLLFFTAARSHPDDPHFAATWQPLITGEIEELTIDCEHNHIAPILEAKLR